MAGNVPDNRIEKMPDDPPQADHNPPEACGGQKRPVFDDFSPCRESPGEQFPGGIKSRAAVWRKLGSARFLAFMSENRKTQKYLFKGVLENLIPTVGFALKS